MKNDPMMTNSYIEGLIHLLKAIKYSRRAWVASDELEVIFWNAIKDKEIK